MAYMEPTLTLIGHAEGVVLGKLTNHILDNAGPPFPRDTVAELESEW